MTCRLHDLANQLYEALNGEEWHAGGVYGLH